MAVFLLWLCAKVTRAGLKRAQVALRERAVLRREQAVLRKERAQERRRQKAALPPPLSQRHIGHGPPLPRHSRIAMEEALERADEASATSQARLVPGTFENRPSRLAAGRYSSLTDAEGGAASAAGGKQLARPTTCRRPSGSSQRVLPHGLPPLPVGPTGANAMLPSLFDVEERLRLSESVRRSATLLRSPTGVDEGPVVNPYALSALQVRQTLQMRAPSRLAAAPPPGYRTAPSTSTALRDPPAPAENPSTTPAEHEAE